MCSLIEIFDLMKSSVVLLISRWLALGSHLSWNSCQGRLRLINGPYSLDYDETMNHSCLLEPISYVDWLVILGSIIGPEGKKYLLFKFLLPKLSPLLLKANAVKAAAERKETSMVASTDRSIIGGKLPA
ncbi:hypothetical protein IEQ34_027033 [Dendrobium chrysotoxum]|uniref:Uncharacterized protein n=1 Tax=Dendrobium chrysotoxum TaxID=161865 RepID=A0AAV7FI84_DENCH|nr:hypothetical protein IEQ34_027033 [Dendrobium chrysotoxum]